MANFWDKSELFWDQKMTKNLKNCQKWSKSEKSEIFCVNLYIGFFKKWIFGILADFGDFWWFLENFWDPKSDNLYIGFLFLCFFLKKKVKKSEKNGLSMGFLCVFFYFFLWKFLKKCEKKVDFWSTFGAILWLKTDFLYFFLIFFYFFYFFSFVSFFMCQ